MEEEEEDSSDDSDGLEGMSLPSDSILHRPHVPSTVIAPQLMAHPARPPKHPARSHTMGGPMGGKRSHHHFEPQRYSGDDMAISYHSPSSLGGGGGGGDVMGTSPVLVNYMSPGQCGSNGESPMQMTPVFSSLEHSRLGMR